MPLAKSTRNDEPLVEKVQPRRAVAKATTEEELFGFLLRPDMSRSDLTEIVLGLDHDGQENQIAVVIEKPLTLYLNDQEIVTMMTIGDHPDFLAVGYLLNQNMLRQGEEVEAVDYDEDLGVVVVRTSRKTNYEEKLKKKTLTSGCAQGTVFGDIMEKLEGVQLSASARLRTTDLFELLRKINGAPSLYLAAGAIHGCALCQGDQPLIYMEDVGRHNAVDKIAGYMHLNAIGAEDKVFFTSGRLTSEMVIKTVSMGIPILVSRSGFTAWGVDLAKQTGLTLVGRAKGKRFMALSGQERIEFNHNE